MLRSVTVLCLGGYKFESRRELDIFFPLFHALGVSLFLHLSHAQPSLKFTIFLYRFLILWYKIENGGHFLCRENIFRFHAGCLPHFVVKTM